MIDLGPITKEEKEESQKKGRRFFATAAQLSMLPALLLFVLCIFCVGPSVFVGSVWLSNRFLEWMGWQ